METEDESSHQSPSNERRSRSRESQREGKEDGPKYWRERSWRREPSHDQEAEEGPGREGQVSLMVERDQLSLILDGFSGLSEDFKIWGWFLGLI